MWLVSLCFPLTSESTPTPPSTHQHQHQRQHQGARLEVFEMLRHYLTWAEGVDIRSKALQASLSVVVCRCGRQPLSFHFCTCNRRGGGMSSGVACMLVRARMGRCCFSWLAFQERQEAGIKRNVVSRPALDDECSALLEHDVVWRSPSNCHVSGWH